MSEPEFDAEGVFDEDYLHFYADRVDDLRSEADTAVVSDVLGLEPASDVLDLACGHGRIANRLAERGHQVTGLDVTPLFLRHAIADAAARKVDVDYVQGDMRALPWTDAFDAVLCWFTSYGYFDDAENRSVLAGVYRALRPGGRFLLELNNYVGLLRSYQPSVVTEADDDLLVDQHRLDPVTGRIRTDRTVVRGGQARRVRYSIRLFTFPEIRDSLRAAGFDEVRAYGEDGESLTASHRRMLVLSRR